VVLYVNYNNGGVTPESPGFSEGNGKIRMGPVSHQGYHPQCGEKYAQKGGK